MAKWQKTLVRCGPMQCADGHITLTAPQYSKLDRVTGYKLSNDALEVLARVGGVAVAELVQDDGTVQIKTMSPTLTLAFKPQYLTTCKRQRGVHCWVYPACGCCCEEDDYILDSDEETTRLSMFTNMFKNMSTTDLPEEYEAKEDGEFVRYTVACPTVWVEGITEFQ